MDDKDKFIDATGTGNEEKPKLGFKDLLAIMIAQFEILMPIAIGAAVIMGLVLLFLLKVWIKA